MQMSGSPPRAWGIRWPLPSAWPARRFTPTRVGNTRPKRRRCLRLPVHPHARGEYPPHPQRNDDATRFTPTRVGNTPAPARRVLGNPVHPHARGEYAERHGQQDHRYGSPPRAWGIRQEDGAPALAERFTPTRVGNTGRAITWPSRRPVHPHARGEYCSASQAARLGCGSPPRAWGIRPRRSPRFCPAPVHPHARGEYVFQRKLSRHAKSVHPHARGEYHFIRDLRFMRNGSPPRAWGIRRPPEWCRR